jgi:NADH dehydrogenase
VAHDRVDTKPLVVVVGAGFGGLAAVKALRKAPVDVLLVDQHNYHLFTPLLYQVASALLDPSEIAYPTRALARKKKNARFRLATVRSIDLENRRIVLDGGALAYDYLILAAGSVNDYFGNAALEQRTYPLKSLDQALALRYHILEQFERASAATDPQVRRRLMSFAIVGGGPTGVEYAGALTELVHLVLRKDFPELDIGEARIVLIDGLPLVLPEFRERLRKAAGRALTRKGVTLELGTFVSGVDEDGVHLRDGRTVEAGTVVWTAGVRASDLTRTLGIDLTKRGQVRVSGTLQVPGHPEVFAIGDLAVVETDGKPLPMVSPVAIQEGDRAARNVIAMVEGRALEPFRYRNRGIMATIGRNQAVAEIGPFRLSGFVAWLVWLFVHLALLIGFRNRLAALLNWGVDYFFYDRPVRLIARVSAPDPEQVRPEERTPTAPRAR